MGLIIQTRFIAASLVLLSLCGAASAQYMDAEQNIRACIERNEYRSCQVASRYSPAVITAAQRQQVEAKMKAIEAGVVKAQPTQTPLNDLEKGFSKAADVIGTVFEIIFGLIALLVIVFLYLKFSRKSEERVAWDNLPVDGPMQVRIEEQFSEAGSFNSKHVPCGLRIDVKISQKDWKAIADAGLMKKVIFYGDGPSGEQYDPENVRPWLVEDLKRPTYASFWDAGRMREAKEELLNSLVNLRATAEALKEGKQVTEFEL